MEVFAYADCLGMCEVWLPAIGWKGIYDVSNTGRIRRVAGGPGARVGSIRTGRANQYGYWYIGLSWQGNSSNHFIHRLVAAAFIGPLPQGMQVNHKDGDKSNNCADNLEYVTPSENQLHRARVLGKGVRAKHYKSNLCAKDILVMKAMYARGLSQNVIARAFGVGQPRVSAMLLGQTWHSESMTHKNFPGRIKLTDDQVEVIRTHYANGFSQFALAVEFGVNQSQISRIISRKRRAVAGVK